MIGYWLDDDGNNAVCSFCNRLNHLYGEYCKHCGTRVHHIKIKQPTGYWMRVSNDTNHFVKCCKCGWEQKTKSNYCPDCGVKME